MGDRLSQEDVDRLLSNPSPESRKITATKIARDFGSDLLSENEQRMAQEILDALLRDAEVQVRQALAEGLKDNPKVPREVALALARDVDRVAVPTLSSAVALSEEDLLAIVRIASSAKLVAIAGREKLSARVSDAVVDRGDEAAVATLVANDGAEIEDATFSRILDDFGGSEAIQGALVDRQVLPLPVAERLVGLVSNQLRMRLVARHELAPELASEVIIEARERATMELITPESDAGEVERLIDQLWRQHRLSPPIVIRALCTGDMLFFEAAMAKLTGVPVDNIKVLISDTGGEGLKRLYEVSPLPPAMFRLVRLAVDLNAELQGAGMPKDRNRYARLMLERLISRFDEIMAAESQTSASS